MAGGEREKVEDPIFPGSTVLGFRTGVLVLILMAIFFVLNPAQLNEEANERDKTNKSSFSKCNQLGCKWK